MKKPEPHEFGVTPEQAQIYRKGRSAQQDRVLEKLGIPSVAVGVVATFLAMLPVFGSFWWALMAGGVLGLFITSPVVYILAHAALKAHFDGLVRLQRNMQLSSLTRARIEQFEIAEARYDKLEQQEIKRRAEIHESRRKVEEIRRREEQVRRQRDEQSRRIKRTGYWASLEPLRFERELGGLYQQLGYSVQLTPQSGDHGVDLVLKKNGKTTVVQCKRQKSPASERIVRELLGSMVGAGAGFTQPAKDFARGLPVDLLSTEQIVGLAERVDRAAVPDDPEAKLSFNGIPICPRRGCGSEMVLRDGRYGRFWGCPKYPNCVGSRQITQQSA